MGNTKHTKEQIRERIQQKKLLFDGAFGTYYGGKYDTKQLPELANLEAPERVKEIHTEYLEAGAQILRTNTFAANSFCMDMSKEQIEETLRSGVRLAREAVAAWRARTGETKEVYIAGDIGQIPWGCAGTEGYFMPRIRRDLPYFSGRRRGLFCL